MSGSSGSLMEAKVAVQSPVSSANAPSAASSFSIPLLMRAAPPRDRGFCLEEEEARRAVCTEEEGGRCSVRLEGVWDSAISARLVGSLPLPSFFASMVFGALADTSLLLSIASDGTLGAAGAGVLLEACALPPGCGEMAGCPRFSPSFPPSLPPGISMFCFFGFSPASRLRS